MFLLHIDKKIKFILLFLSIFILKSALVAQNCQNRVFNIKISDSVTTNEILNQLSDSCHFSIIQSDEHTKSVLNSQISGINIKDMTLNEIFDILVEQRDLSYEFNNNLLKISAFQTKTFKIDYITSIRTGHAITKASVNASPVKIDGDNDKNSDNGEVTKLDNAITTKEKFDFWENLSDELTAILSNDIQSINGQQKTTSPAIIINKNAGLVTITASNSQLNRVEKYIKDLEQRLKKQVMLDVSIISVTLDNEYKKGVDWSKFELGFNSYLGNGSQKDADGNKLPSNIQFGTGTNDNPAQSLRNITGGFVLGGGVNLSIDGVLNFLETNGKAKVVSSPKIMTMNNQQALITVGSNINYRTQEDTTHNGTTTTTNTTFTNYSVFIGMLLNILPEVSDDDKIMLRINPSLSEFKYSQDDTYKANADIRTIAPDTNQKQLSTVVQVNSGDTIVLGGLIGEANSKNINKVPLLGDLPIIGNLFKSDQDIFKTTELIFIIKPKVVNIDNPNTIKSSLKDLGFSESIYE